MLSLFSFCSCLAIIFSGTRTVLRVQSADASPNCDGILLGVLCPVSCVADLSMCLAASRNCTSPDLHLCPDGKCRPGLNRHVACQDVTNVCHCHESSPIACARSIASVPKSSADDQDLVRSFCFQRFNQSSSLGACSSSASANHNEIKRIQAAIYYALIGFGLYAFILTGWVFWRSALTTDGASQDQRLYNSVLRGSISRLSTSVCEPHPQYGYRESAVGNAVFGIGVVWTLALLGIGVTICCYYYRFIDLDARWIEEVPFDDLSTAFIIAWNVLFLWLLALKISGRRLNNFFRIQTSMQTATTVDIWWAETEHIDMAGGSPTVRLVHKIRSFIRNRIQGFNGLGHYRSVPVRTTPGGRRYIEFASQRMMLNSFSGQWEPVTLSTDEMDLTYAELTENVHNGISSAAAVEKLDIEGPNSIEMITKTQSQIILDEFSKSSYLYQGGCLAVECYMSYWIVAFIHFFVIVAVAVVRAVMKKTAFLRTQKHSERWGLITVDALRDGKLVPVMAKDIVSGDIIALDQLRFVPFDGVLLSGIVTVDESSLSGDPVPKLKRQFSPSSDVYRKSVHGMHTIFAGSSILHQEKEAGKYHCVAFVVDKGINTIQGKLVKASFYPRRIVQAFQYELEVAYFILVAWSAIAFLVTLTSVVIIKATVNAWFYGMFTLCNVIIPLLPTFLKFGPIQSCRVLRERGVFMNNPKRILTAAKVRIFAFDKTGTLTKSGFVLSGIVPVINGEFVATENKTGCLQIETIAQNMACAHCLSVHESGDLSGTEIDMEMFRLTGWSLTHSGDCLTVKSFSGDKTFDIIRQIQHNQNQMRMCSIVRDRQTQMVYIFLKGSPESIASVASHQSVPSNFKRVFMQHAREGFYTLALAYRAVGQMSDAEVSSMDVRELENDCRITSLLLFKNPLRPEAAHVMNSLREADIRPIILTGDNLFSASHVAEQLNLIQSDDTVLFADLNDAGDVSWTDLRTGRNVSFSHVLKSIDVSRETKCELAASGPAVRVLASNGFLDSLLFHIRVFATLSSTDKKNVVMYLQRKTVVAMCGDGGNDYEALQVAHVGLGFSENEFKIPSVFAADASSITSCIDLISCGRSALRINQNLYRFSMMYGETLLWAGFLGYSLDVLIPINVWAFTDVSVLLSIAAVLAFSHPSNRLSGKRPTARLLGPSTLVLIIGTVLINIFWACLAIVFLYQQDFLACNQFNANGIATAEWWKIQDNAETAVISIVVMFQCIFSGAATMLDVNRNKRSRMSRSGIFVTASLLSFLTVMVLSEPNTISCLMRINCGTQDVTTNQLTPSNWNQFYVQSRRDILPYSFRTKLIIFCLINGACIVLFHLVATRGPVTTAIQNRFRSANRLKLKI